MKHALLFLLIVVCLIPASAQIDWPHNEFDEGLAAGGIPPSQFSTVTYVTYSKVIPSHPGTYWVVYTVSYPGGFGSLRDTLYVQKVNSSGNALFGQFSQMPKVGTESINGAGYKAVSDGNGGILFIYSNNGIVVQRINASGQLMFGPSGKTVTTTAASNFTLEESNGNYFVTWWDVAAKMMRAQRLNTNGDNLWQASGIPVMSNTFPSAVSRFRTSEDGNGGLAVLYERGDSLFWQILNASGERSLVSDVLLSLFVAKSFPTTLTEIVYTSGQWYFAFDDVRYGNNNGLDIFMMKVVRTSFGQILSQWSADTGKTVCRYPGDQKWPKIVLDKQGGVILSWVDERNIAQQGKAQVYAQRFSSGDAPMWILNGTQVSSNYNSAYIQQFDPIPQSNGVIFPLKDEVYGIYAQKLNMQGSLQWFNSVGRIHSFNNVLMLDCFAEPGGNIFVVYYQYFDKTFRVKLLDGNGFLGFNSPRIADVKDIINDQGGKVSVVFNASWRELNPPPSQYSTNMYRLYRGLSAANIPEGSTVLKGELPATHEAGTLMDLDITSASGAPIYWEQIAEIVPQNIEGYAKVSATTSDSGRQGTPWNYFMSAYGNFTSIPPLVWYSNIDSGYSVDNLPPFPPQAASGSMVAGVVQLHWKKNFEADFAEYEIYRSTTSGFVPNEQNLLAKTVDTLYRDNTAQSNTAQYYIIKAVDVNGNRSQNSAVISMNVMDVSTTNSTLPTEYALDQNYPNPFNPTTNISFALPSAGFVSLKVFDALGRTVETLVNEFRSAGRYTVSFGGGHLSSGLYICEVRTEQFTKRIKMNLIK